MKKHHKGKKHMEHEKREPLFEEEREEVREDIRGTHKEFGGVFG